MQAQNPLIVLFYDPATRQLSGRNGEFVSCEEFFSNPPMLQEDLFPDDPQRLIDDPTPILAAASPTRKCINGKVHICNGTSCYLKLPQQSC